MDRASEEKSYQEISSLTLSGYQLIEARLKSYLKDYFKIVKHRLGSEIHFDFDGHDYDNAALGTLLKVFAKTCADSQLVKNLRAEIPHRDHVAHQSLLVLYKRQACSAEELSVMAKELSQRSESIIKLLGRLHEVHSALLQSSIQRGSSNGA